MIESIVEWFDDIYRSVRQVFRSLKRAWDFAKIGYSNYDWDHAYVWELLEFKLKRVKYALVNGCAIHEPEHLAALDEAIAISGRLHNHDYGEKYDDAHTAKWGERPPWKSIPNFDKDGKVKTYSIDWGLRPNVKTDADKEEERQDFRSIMDKEHEDRKNDLCRIGVLLAEHSDFWWD